MLVEITIRGEGIMIKDGKILGKFNIIDGIIVLVIFAYICSNKSGTPTITVGFTSFNS